MAYTLDVFCRDCAASLRADPGPGGKEQIRQNLERLLGNQRLRRRALRPGCRASASMSSIATRSSAFACWPTSIGSRAARRPHDHGSSWAIYGQATAYTDMTEYRRLDGACGPGHAELEVTRRYRLEPGHAGLYDVGAIHAIAFGEDARFVRVTGADLEQVPRLKFDLEERTAVGVASATMQRAQA